MKSLSFLAVILFTLALASCQREIDWNLPGGSSGGTTGNTLFKMVLSDGTDSVTSNLSYDGSKRLIRLIQSGMWGGVDATSDMKIYRNSSGIITRTAQSTPALVSAGIDSIQTFYYFNVATNRYIASSFSVIFSGITLVDSINFSYDGVGNLTRAEHLQSVFGQPFFPAIRTDFTYSGAGNISSIKGYTFDITTASWTLETTEEYTFDSKNVPLRLSQNKEGIVLLLYNFFNVNNPVTYTFSNMADPASNYSETHGYTYNGNNKPLTDTTSDSGTVTSIMKYYYQ